MLNFVKKVIGKGSMAVIGMLLPWSGGSFLDAYEKQNFSVQSVKDWKRFHSVPGKCLISLPSAPEHVKQTLPFSEVGHDLRYDVYFSTFEKKAVYMMLVAQYPSVIDESYVQMGLESFLNGLITNSSDNQLVFADLVEVQGHQALDFFIKSNETYFKGRALITHSSLYLLAMECEGKNYLDDHFNHFINSFEMMP